MVSEDKFGNEGWSPNQDQHYEHWNEETYSSSTSEIEEHRKEDACYDQREGLFYNSGRLEAHHRKILLLLEGTVLHGTDTLIF